MAGNRTPRRRPGATRPDEPLTIKQERAARREEKLAALRAEQVRRRRNAKLATAAWVAGAIAVFGLLVAYVIGSGIGRPDPRSVDIAGVEEFPGLSSTHVAQAVTYPESPPVGGDHAGQWLNCGVYTEPVPAVNAVHSLEHGAVWVGYDATVVTQEEIDRLVSSLPGSYVIVSPYEGLASPVVASAWGVQVQLDGADDARLGQFVGKYTSSPGAPEPGAACAGGLDGPGRVA